MEILDKAFKLGQEIKKLKEYQAMKNTEAVMRVDREAIKLLKDFRDLQNSYDRMMLNGYELTEENKKALQELENKAMSYPKVKAYYEKSMAFCNLMEQVHAKIDDGIKECSANSCSSCNVGGG